MPALETLCLAGNPLGDEGLDALVAPPPPAPAVVLTKLKKLDLFCTKVTDTNPYPNPNPDPNPNPYPYQVTDASCKALVAAIRSGALPALKGLELEW
jgi:hypothetical protein